MFQGFTEETDSFFMAIRFNNNVDFFHQNHDWYERAVRTPLKELAADLAPIVSKLDSTLETRPERVVSRINRDLRFSRDKSPYRDYMWLAFKPPKNEFEAGIGVYFDISAESASYGMMVHDEKRYFMTAFRRALAVSCDDFMPAARKALKTFTLMGDDFKRIQLPEGLPAEAKPWYVKKYMWLSHPLSRAELSTPALVSEIQRGLKEMTPLYRWMGKLQLSSD